MLGAWFLVPRASFLVLGAWFLVLCAWTRLPSMEEGQSSVDDMEVVSPPLTLMKPVDTTGPTYCSFEVQPLIRQDALPSSNEVGG